MPFVYHSYKGNEKLCRVNCMQFYLGGRNYKDDNNNKNLIITYRKPHNNASTDSLLRGIKDELTNAGVNVNKYSPEISTLGVLIS